MKETLGMVLAGGRGERLGPLTQDRSKPAVPFCGKYRIVDCVLNNFINSGLYRIKVLTQYKADSLIRHITTTYSMNRSLGMYVDPVPAQMRIGDSWYRGTADAIYQNANIIQDENPARVAVFGGDHVYKMDLKQMIDYHKEKNADLTISAIPVPVSHAHHFGIIVINDDWQIVGFVEKPKENPATIPGRPDMCLASMGNYVFNTHVLLDELDVDAHEESQHDFGKNIIRKMIPSRRVFAYDFAVNRPDGSTDKEIGYWRDVGTVDSYFETNMDMRSVSPVLNLYNRKWPFRSYPETYPPAKFVFDEFNGRRGEAVESLLSEGCIISGARARRSVFSPGVFLHSYSDVEESILFDKVDVGRYAKIRRAIIDKGVQIPPHYEIGYNLDEDRKKFFVSDGGIVVVPKGMKL